MEHRVAMISIIAQETEGVEQLNALLHEYAPCIIGRMGIPYRQRGIHIISVAMDAPQDAINTLAGKLGKIEGISAKTAYSNLTFPALQK